MFLGHYSITVKDAPAMNYQNTAFFRRLFRIRKILKNLLNEDKVHWSIYKHMLEIRPMGREKKEYKGEKRKGIIRNHIFYS